MTARKNSTTVRKLEDGGYLVNERFIVSRNGNESVNSAVAWVVIDYLKSDDWVYEAATKRECIAWCEKR